MALYISTVTMWKGWGRDVGFDSIVCIYFDHDMTWIIWVAQEAELPEKSLTIENRYHEGVSNQNDVKPEIHKQSLQIDWLQSLVTKYFFLIICLIIY